MGTSFWAILVALLASLAPQAPMKATQAPHGHDISWGLTGPGGGGWIESIAWDPHNSKTLYVGCDVGGFYISPDGGKSFQIRNNGLRDYFIEAIAVHPGNSDIILLGTESGIFRTADRGKSWQWVRNGFPPLERWSFSSPIGAVCFDPQKPSIAYAGVGRPRWSSGGQGAIYKSEDTGLTWRNVSAGQLPPDAIVSDLEVKPVESHVILAATSKGLFRSDDEGKTWKLSSDGLPHLYTEELAFAPSSPNTVYVSLRTTARDGQPWNGGIFRSDDAGHTWHPINGQGMAMQMGKSAASPYMSSNYKEIAVDLRNSEVVYAGNRDWVTAGIRKTTDGGRSWKYVTRYFDDNQNMDYGWITQWGPSVECMAISPADPNRIAFGTGGHVFVTMDGGKRWQQRYCRQFPDGRFTGNGLEVTCLFNIIPDPVRPRRVYFCFYDIGLLISDDHGKTFRRSFKGMKNDGNCFTVVADPQKPSTLWAGTGQWASNVGDICRSDDNGQSWQVVGKPESGLPNGQTRYLLLDLKSPVARRRLLVASNGNGIHESRDGGNAWHPINGNLPAGAAKEPRGLLLDPQDSSHIIVALGGIPDRGAGIYETRDGGTIWQKLNREPLFADITNLAADPRNFATLYVDTRESYDQAAQRTYPGGAFQSTDGGKTWQHILDYRFVNAIAVSPANPRIIYAGTADHPYHDDPIAEGILKSSDGGKTWQHENTGLSHLNISCLSINPHNPSIIYIGTGGNGGFIGQDSAVRLR